MNVRFPTHYSILYSGPPGVGKLEQFLGLTREFLTGGERIVFVTLDYHPDEIRSRAAGLGVDLAATEGERFAFVDCYSASASEHLESGGGKKTYPVSSFSNLEGIGMAISRAAHDLKPPVRILFYTVSTLFLHNSIQAIAKFIQIITSRVKTNVGFVAYAMHEGVHDVTTTNLLRSLVDGVVEMRFTEDLVSELRVHHLKGLKAPPGWVRIPEPGALPAIQGGGAHG